ncbi:DUF3263 domain-containing protein [Marisediminicola sp. LYQ134]|uniref:DUF3263 domain-containing protein n=1 Tax=Marisediminicola sp. LYQ134 TaxID=3391061 RepID=UPI0039834B99
MTAEIALCAHRFEDGRYCMHPLKHTSHHHPKPTVVELLALEQKHPARTPAKQTAIAATGYSVIRYYQAINQLLTDPEAFSIDPHTITRIRQYRDERTAARRTRTTR